MSYSKYVILLCVLFVACKNKANTANQTTTPSEVPSEEVKFTMTKPEPKVEPKEIKIDTVTVSNLVDLVDNAKSNTVLILKKGTYKLDKDLVYLMSKDERVIIDKKVIETRSIGGQLHFSGLSNFQIKGEKGVSIVSEHPKAVAFFLLSCKNVIVSNLIIKKNIKGEAELCYISNSQDIEFDKCRFDGGGSYGIYTNNVDNVTIRNSIVTKCSVGAIKINDSRDLKFVNTTITKNTTLVPLVFFYGTGSIAAFNDVKIVNNKRNEKSTFIGSENIFGLGVNMIKLDNCVIRDNKGFKNLGMGQNNLIRTEISGVAMQ